MSEVIEIALVVAAAKNGVIGIENRLPWHLPADLKHFRDTTMGKPIIMGRKTFESIGKALPGRTNIVVSRNTELALPEGVLLAQDVAQAVEQAKQIALQTGVNEIMVIGGEQIYRVSMPLATRIYLTEVDADPEGDAFFAYQSTDWQRIELQSFEATDDNPYNYRFCILEKRATT